MKTQTKITKPLVVISLALLHLLTTSCHGQQKTDNKLNASKPDIRYKVDKKYDKKGNVIRYDSTYSYSYNGELNDSIVSGFHKNFKSFFDYGRLTAPGTPDTDSTFWYFNDRNFESMFKNDPFFDEFDREMKQMHDQVKKDRTKQI